MSKIPTVKDEFLEAVYITLMSAVKHILSLYIDHSWHPISGEIHSQAGIWEGVSTASSFAECQARKFSGSLFIPHIINTTFLCPTMPLECGWGSNPWHSYARCRCATALLRWYWLCFRWERRARNQWHTRYTRNSWSPWTERYVLLNSLTNTVHG